ncbi:MAG: hypothetical protein NWF00_07660 [Candidatus Bathyarchaeota archaeon]|nr:hypothetical protein [Candidatus Bathyarchaeota archaeon]
MSENEDLVGVLKRLGLTFVQAKTYLALNQIGEEATIETVAKTARVGRQHVYAPLSALEKLGLVQKVLGAPPKYTVLPAKTAVSILLEIRRKESCELQNQASFLIESLQKDHATAFLSEKERTLFLVGSAAFSREVDRALVNARVCFDGTATVELFRRGMFHGGENHRRALKRGVSYRHVISRANSSAPLGDEDLVGNSVWAVRFSSCVLPFQMTIVDRKEVFISTRPDVTKECSYYWSNNTCFLILAQSYFDILWKQSIPRNKFVLKTNNE